ncbi:DsbA family protein [Chitinophaga silvatica]|uniref:DsbA family protein n=1 Tax=Chitinophaga silvatica TaxID=2282649 RepID=A0A3E1Y7P0_9BACT|nr:DsbA family protein [Chitinophaga silvatica]RFS21097.1 DsbA family protein [Chitinophaga silvatica]
MATLTPAVSSQDHTLGPKDAAIEIVEYGDFQCPFCREAYYIIKQWLDEYENRFRFVFRHFPLTEAHEYALDAALSAEAAGRQNRFWDMHDAIYDDQPALNDGLLVRLAKTLDLDLHKFSEDVEDKSLLIRVNDDFESGVRSGVNGTPTFFVNGKRYNGDYKDIPSMFPR